MSCNGLSSPAWSAGWKGLFLGGSPTDSPFDSRSAQDVTLSTPQLMVFKEMPLFCVVSVPTRRYSTVSEKEKSKTTTTAANCLPDFFNPPVVNLSQELELVD